MDPAPTNEPDGQQPEEEEGGERWRRVLAALLLLGLLAALLCWLFSLFAVVPDVIGLSEEDARVEIEDAGFVVGDVSESADGDTPRGGVSAQSPDGGSRSWKGTEVDITVSTGGSDAGADDSGSDSGGGSYVPPPPAEPEDDDPGDYVPSPQPPGPLVPLVMGLSEADARAKLSNAGYGATVTYDKSTTDIPPGIVMYQDPAPDTVLSRGNSVEIRLSTGPPIEGSFD